MKFKYIIFILLLKTLAFSQNELEISKEFSLFTSKNLSGFIKPFSTTLSESINSSLYTSSNYNNGWSFGLDLSICGMNIPKSQRNFNAELPLLFGDTNVVFTAQSKNGQIIKNVSGFVSEPTIYGGKSLPVFSSPRNEFPPDSFYKSVAFAEGNDINFMSGIPILQLILGLPTRSQIRLRFATFPILNSNLYYYTIILNQNIDKLFNIFEVNSPYSIGASFAFHSIFRNPGININSYSVGANFSGKIFENLSYFGGLQYEDLNGEINAIRKNDNNDIVNSPYEEVRRGDPLKITLSSFTQFKALLGANYRFGILELHIESAFATQPMVSGGLTFWMFDTGENVNVFEPINIPEKVDPLPEISHIFESNDKEFSTSKLSKQSSPIKSNIKILNLDGTEEVKQITVETYHSRQLRPFLPYIFYEENQSEIPAKYIKFSKEQTKNFNMKNLKGMNSLETYYYVLNILGKRMLEFPNTQITLIGCNSNIGIEKNNKKLSKQRAENIKKYLTEIWNIEPNRIKVTNRNLPEKFSNNNIPEGISENRRVEIVSEDWDINSPVIIEDTLRFIKPLGILVKNNVSSQIPIQKWEFNINSNDENIVKMNGKGTPDNQFKINFENNENLKSKIVNELSAFLKVDNAEETGISEINKIPVNIIVKDSSINVYNMILFDFNKSYLSRQNLKITDYINKDLKEDAEVKVVGYTDKIGDEKYNQQLSTERALSTASSLNTKNIEIVGKGTEEYMFDNSTPEGRFYNRTVQVLIKQENK